MNAGNLWFFLKILPLVVVTAVIFAYFGWWLRHKFHAPVVSSSKPAAQDDLPARERVRKLEHNLTKSEKANKELKHELETLQAKSVPKATHEKTEKDLADAQHRVEGDLKRIAALEADLKKARDAVNSLNSKATDSNKGQLERTFALENELSRVRGEIADLQARPDNSAALQTEVDRLREALVNSTRVVGELRKQEAAAVQARQKAERKLEVALANAKPAPTGGTSLLPILEQALTPAVDRTADAKADLERIQAANAREQADPVAADSIRHAQSIDATASDETARLTAEQAAAEQAAADKAAADKAAAEQAAAEQAAADKAAADKTAADKAAAEAVAPPPVAMPQTDLFAAHNPAPPTDSGGTRPVA